MAARSFARDVLAMIVVTGAVGVAQEAARPGLPIPPVGPAPYVFDTAEQPRVKVAVLTRELSHPWPAASAAAALIAAIAIELRSSTSSARRLPALGEWIRATLPEMPLRSGVLIAVER